MPGENTYIDWECTPDKKLMCDHFKNKWGNLKVSVLKEANEEVCVKLSQFKTAEYKKKNGEVGKRLELFNEDFNLEQISAFIDDLFLRILHHRNQLKTTATQSNTCVITYGEHSLILTSRRS